MEIQVHPSRIHSPASGLRPSVDRQRLREERLKSSAPGRAEENFIPEPESLASMIRNALSALRDGIFWDRGTILNILA